jgi:hypothetical protein
MARISHNTETSKSSNPTSKYLDWKSNDKAFEYYDKNAGEKVKVGLPLKFVFLQHYHTVKGWHDPSESNIYSNEVFYIGSEQMTVRSFGNKKKNLPAVEIASGIYTEMKPKIISAGGKYHRSVYVMLEDGTIANLSFKGAVVREWSDFMEKNKNLVDGQWIEVNSAKDQKKGSIKYSTPEFTMGSNLTAKQSSQADVVASQLKEYLDGYFNKEEAVEFEDVELDF